MKKTKKNDITILEDNNPDYFNVIKYDNFTCKIKIIIVSILIIYLTGLITFSISPGNNLNINIPNYYGMLLHYFGYLFLFSIMSFCFFIFNNKYFFSKTIGCGIIIAIATEIIQLFIPGRSGNFPDICINLFGLFTIPILLIIIYELFFIKIEEQKI